MKWFNLVQPFVKYILLGTLYVLTGAKFLQYYNHIIGELTGLACIFWGGFNLFIGAIGYGTLLFLFLFIKIKSRNKREQLPDHDLIDIITSKTTSDISKKKYLSAINKLKFLVVRFPHKMEFRYQLADLYLTINKPVKAGKLLYLKESRTDREQKAVQIFNQYYADNSYVIFKKVINLDLYNIEFLKEHRLTFLSLAESIPDSDIEEEAIKSYIDNAYHQINMPAYKKVLKEYNEKDFLISLAVYIILSLFLLLSRLLA